MYSVTKSETVNMRCATESGTMNTYIPYRLCSRYLQEYHNQLQSEPPDICTDEFEYPQKSDDTAITDYTTTEK